MRLGAWEPYERLLRRANVATVAMQVRRTDVIHRWLWCAGRRRGPAFSCAAHVERRRASGDREGQCNPQTRSACVRAITRGSSDALGFDQREDLGQFFVSLFQSEQ